MIVSCSYQMFPVQQCFLMSYFSILAPFGGNVFEMWVPQCIFSFTSWAVCSLVLLISYSPSTEANIPTSKSALQGVSSLHLPVHCTSWAEPIWVSICNVRLLLKLTGLSCLQPVVLLQTSCVALFSLSFGLAQTEANHACELHSINSCSSSTSREFRESTMAATPAEFGVWMSQRLLCVDASLLKAPFSA